MKNAAWVTASLLCLCVAGRAQTPDELIRAVRNNDLNLLKTGDANAKDSRGSTLLMHAAAFGTADEVKLLLDRGADVNAKNQFDATALIWGANDPAKVKLLLAKGADVNAVSKNGRNALMAAATCDGCSDTVRLLLDKGADAKAKDSQGTTALYSAAQANDIESMRLLIEHGADPNLGDGGGFSPVMIAASHCNVPAVRMLLSKGANVNAGSTFAGEVKFGKIQLIHLTPLMMTVPYCSSDTVKVLLDAGAKVNEKDGRNMTPLMFAVASEHQDLGVVNLLLKSGAELDVKSTMGETALDWARKFGNRQVIAALEKAGAHPGDPFVPPEANPAPQRTSAEAAKIALSLLQRTSTEFFKQSGCVGCHNQPITTAAYGVAKAFGVPADETTAKQHVVMLDSETTRSSEFLLERIEGGGATDPPAFFLFSMAMAQFPADAGTDAAVIYLAGAQHRDGTWRLDGVSRSPMQESVIGRSAIAVRVLQQYGQPAKKAEFDARIARTRDWMLEAKAETNDDYAMQMLGLQWAGVPAAKVKALGRALIATQRADGGWAQNRNLSSDAYATGEALWALREAGVATVSDPVYQRGVKFLLSTQKEDGSWYVRSRAVKLQPYFQSGFPYNHDQWISSTATGYAVIALAPVR